MKQTLGQLLEVQQTTLLSLIDLLKQERVAITRRKALEIEQIAKEKLDLIYKIQQHDYLLSSHEEREQLTQIEEYQSQVAAIQNLVQECQQYNDINGEVLQRAHLSFHKLNNLFQQSRGRHQMTYNSEGIAQNVRSLGTNLKA